MAFHNLIKNFNNNNKSKQIIHLYYTLISKNFLKYLIIEKIFFLNNKDFIYCL